MKENKEEKTNARRILKLFSSSRGSSGSLLFLGVVYRGHLIHSCYSRARFCALLLRWCFLGDFLKKIIFLTKTDQDPKSFHFAFFPSGLPLGFSVGHTHALILFNLNTFVSHKQLTIMIADAFFAFLSWVRLLFFNREMELALIGEM